MYRTRGKSNPKINAIYIVKENLVSNRVPSSNTLMAGRFLYLTQIFLAAVQGHFLYYIRAIHISLLEYKVQKAWQ